MSVAGTQPNGQITLGEATYSPSKSRYFSTTIIELLSEIIGVDPTQTKLHLDDHVCLDELDAGMKRDYDAGREVTLIFQYGGYTIECNSCGHILVLADADLYERDEVPLPPSMRTDLR